VIAYTTWDTYEYKYFRSEASCTLHEPGRRVLHVVALARIVVLVVTRSLSFFLSLHSFVVFRYIRATVHCNTRRLSPKFQFSAVANNIYGMIDLPRPISCCYEASENIEIYLRDKVPEWGYYLSTNHGQRSFFGPWLSEAIRGRSIA
jgi:hypothetical protein